MAVKCIEYQINPCEEIPSTVVIENDEKNQEHKVDVFLTRYLRTSKIVEEIKKNGMKVSFSTPESTLLQLARYLSIDEKLLKTSHIYVIRKKFHFL